MKIGGLEKVAGVERRVRRYNKLVLWFKDRKG